MCRRAAECRCPRVHASWESWQYAHGLLGARELLGVCVCNYYGVIHDRYGHDCITATAHDYGDRFPDEMHERLRIAAERRDLSINYMS